MKFKQYLNKLTEQNNTVLKDIEKNLVLFKKLLNNTKCSYHITDDTKNIYKQSMCQIIIDKVNNIKIKDLPYEELDSISAKFLSTSKTKYISVDANRNNIVISVRIYDNKIDITDTDLMSFVKSVLV